MGPRAEGRRPHRRGPPALTPHPTPRLLLLPASPQPAAPRRQVVSAPGLTPVIFIEVAPSSGGAAAGTVLLYGHADTQPPFVGWSDGLSPYKPTLRDGKLYGRGACDDGYSIFAAVTAIMALKAQVPYPLRHPLWLFPAALKLTASSSAEQKLEHGRLIMLMEASEESGSIHLPQHLTTLKERIGIPNLIVCLDSGCGNCTVANLESLCICA